MSNNIAAKNKHPITIKEARKLLGKGYRDLPDSYIKDLTKSLQNFATIFLDSKNPRPP
jgi:hypothetical protein